MTAGSTINDQCVCNDTPKATLKPCSEHPKILPELVLGSIHFVISERMGVPLYMHPEAYRRPLYGGDSKTAQDPSNNS